mgnify:CR=1 FL=1
MYTGVHFIDTLPPVNEDPNNVQLFQTWQLKGIQNQQNLSKTLKYHQHIKRIVNVTEIRFLAVVLCCRASVRVPESVF